MVTELLFDVALFETGQLYAEQRPNGLFRVISTPLTRAALERHVAGETTFGVQLAQDGTGLCKAGCIELRGRIEPKTHEVAPGELEALWERVVELHALAAARQIFTWAEHVGGVGWRAWVFAAAPVKAAVLRTALRRLANEAGLSSSAPMYPAYNSALLTGWVKLPPNVDRVTGFWSGFVTQRFDALNRLTEGPSWTAGAPDIPLDQASILASFQRTSAAALAGCDDEAAVTTRGFERSPLSIADMRREPPPVEAHSESGAAAKDAEAGGGALDFDWRAEFQVLAYMFQRPDSRQTLRRTVHPSDFRGCTDVSVGDEGDEASVEHATLYAAALAADRPVDAGRLLREMQIRETSACDVQPMEIIERMIGALLSVEGLSAEGFMRDVAHIRMRSTSALNASPDGVLRIPELPAQATLRRASDAPPDADAQATANLESSLAENSVSDISSFVQTEEPHAAQDVSSAMESDNAPPYSELENHVDPFAGADGTAGPTASDEPFDEVSVTPPPSPEFVEPSLRTPALPLDLVAGQLTVADRSRRSGEFQPLDALAPTFLARLLDAPQCVPTISEELNLALGGGFRRGELYVIAAPQQGGKTTFVGNALDHCAAQKTPALMMSYGLTREQLYFAGLAREAGVSLADIDGRRWRDETSPSAFELSQKLAQAARSYQLKGEYLAIVEANPADSVNEVRRLVERMRAHYELSPGSPALVAIDAIQDMTLGETDLGYVMPESWRIRRLMSRLKQLARDLDVAIIVTAEIDETAYLRALTAGRFKRYALSGAMGLFTSADVVLLVQTGYIRAGFETTDPADGDPNREMLMDQLQLLQEEYVGQSDARRLAARIRKEFPLTEGDAQACYARVSVMKNRSGKLATCLFAHQRAWQRFAPLAVRLPDQDLDDIPTGAV
jgi:replicative DNA helicase